MKIVRPVLLLALAIGGLASAHPLGTHSVQARTAFSRAATAQTTIQTNFQEHQSSATPMGTVNLAQLATIAQNTTTSSVDSSVKQYAYREPKGYGTLKSPNAVPAMPALQPSAVVPLSQTNQFFSFPGLSNATQHPASGFTFEPPDGGLCAGNGLSIEAINEAVQVYNKAGTPQLAAPVGLKTLFATVVVSTTDIMGDPQCYYDALTGHWFITQLDVSLTLLTGAVGPTYSYIDVAVSTTSSPTGAFSVFRFDSSDTVPPFVEPGCPCIGDQPVLGADTSSIYVSVRSFPTAATALPPFFNGTDVFVISKHGLESGGPVVNFVEVQDVADPDHMPADHLNFVQPTPGSITNNMNFAPYTFDEYATDNRIGVFALTGDNAIDSPSFTFLPQYWTVIPTSQMYINPASDNAGAGDAITQRSGPNPRCMSLGLGVSPLQANDDGIVNSRLYAGRIGAAWNTGVTGPNQGTVDASEYAEIQANFVTTPLGPVLTARLLNNGVISAGNDTFFFPIITGNVSGQAIMSGTLVGVDYFPTAAWIRISAPLLQHNNVITPSAGFGTAPEDGFTCYNNLNAPVVNTPCRWGDYSGAATDTDNSFWVEAEGIYAPPGPRTLNGNWGTIVATGVLATNPPIKSGLG